MYIVGSIAWMPADKSKGYKIKTIPTLAGMVPNKTQNEMVAKNCTLVS